MIRPSRLPLLAAVLAVAAVSAGCDREDDDSPAVAAPSGEAGAIEGLSREQISKQVQPLTPEEAERMGMVDTIVRPDTSGGSSLSPVIPGTPPPVPVGGDTARGGPPRRGGTPP